MRCSTTLPKSQSCSLHMRTIELSFICGPWNYILRRFIKLGHDFGWSDAKQGKNTHRHMVVFSVVYTHNQFEITTISFFTALFPSSTPRHDSWSLYGCPKPRRRESRNSHVTRGVVYNICLFSNAALVSPSDSCHAHVHPCVSRLTAIFGLLHSSRTKQHEERSVAP